MKILTKLKQLLTVAIRQDDDVILYTERVKVVIKYNDIGLSVDYYKRGELVPFREDQVWFTD
jgi:hypothetical protein